MLYKSCTALTSSLFLGDAIVAYGITTMLVVLLPIFDQERGQEERRKYF
jgi:hypothetical protein